jgi:hypothetical protein
VIATKFGFVINLTTVKALGLDVPAGLLLLWMYLNERGPITTLGLLQHARSRVDFPFRGKSGHAADMAAMTEYPDRQSDHPPCGQE